MKKIITPVLAILFTLNIAIGQDLELQFDQEKFGDQFSAMVVEDLEYNYYVVDLTKFSSRFEKIYFLNLIYQDQKVVNIDPDVDGLQMWFKAYDRFDINEITCLLNDQKDQAIEAGASFTDAERSKWLESHDKYLSKQVKKQ